MSFVTFVHSYRNLFFKIGAGFGFAWVILLSLTVHTFNERIPLPGIFGYESVRYHGHLGTYSSSASINKSLNTMLFFSKSLYFICLKYSYGE